MSITLYHERNAHIQIDLKSIESLQYLNTLFLALTYLTYISMKDE